MPRSCIVPVASSRLQHDVGNVSGPYIRCRVWGPIELKVQGLGSQVLGTEHHLTVLMHVALHTVVGQTGPAIGA